MRNHRCCWLLRIVVALALALDWGTSLALAQAQSQPAAEKWETTEDLWYTLELMGAKAGWTHSLIETDGQRYRSTNQMHMKISRGAMPVEINSTTTFIESMDGKPLEVQMTQKTSLQSMTMKWVFEDDHITQTAVQGGRETQTRQPLPEGEWLTPMAVDRFSKQQRQAAVEEFTYRTIEPENGFKPMAVTSRRAAKEQFQHGDTTIEVEVWNIATQLGSMTIESVEKLQPDGTAVYHETSLMGLGKMIGRLSTKSEAQGGNGDAPELLVQSFVTPDKPIANSMKAVKAKLRLKVKQGTMPELPSTGAQRAEMSADGKSAVLTIDINNSLPASEADAANPEYRAASAFVDSNDELIQKLAKGAVARSQEEDGKKVGADTAMRRAEALRRLARKHISKKGMETAFASASETAKMRTGDCSEHGVLLCALLRADGIPARVATGLIYADAFAGHEGIFGWHMWTQALIDGKWVDFDATLPQRYNATHILTATSSLSDGLGASDLVSVLQLLGNLEIEVLDVQYD